MKKMTFLLLGAAAALTACSTTETVNAPAADVIGFAGAHIGYPTESRAVSEITDVTLSSFQVFGQYTSGGGAAVQVFNNVEVAESGGSWTYTGGLRPWVAGANYVFAAYAPANAIAAPAVNAAGYLTLTDYTVYNNQKDLIYAAATATGLESGNNPVGFTFNHLLSIVGLTFQSGFDVDTQLTFTDVMINGVPSTATFTANGTTGASQLGGSWGAASSEQNYNLTIAQITAAEGTSSDNIVVIPQSVPDDIQVSFKVTATTAAGVTIADNKTFTTTLPVDQVSAWTPGYKYNYVAKITPESIDLEYIQFTVQSVTPWETEDDQDLSLQ